MSKLNKVQKAWSDKIGREIAFETKEVKAHDGREQTQLINPETNAVVVAVNLVGDEAEKVLVEQAGTTFIDSAFSQPEIDGPAKVVEIDNRKPEDNEPTESDEDREAREQKEAEKKAKAEEAKAEKERKAKEAKEKKEAEAKAKAEQEAEAKRLKAEEDAKKNGGNQNG